MKFWLLTTEYPPFFGGGIATYCYHQSHMLASHGHNVTVFVNDGALSENVTTSQDGDVRVIRFKPGQREIYKHLGYIAALSYEFSEMVEELIRAEGPPDVIECQEYLAIGYFLLQKKKVNWPLLKDIPILVTTHTPKFTCDKVDQAPVYKHPDYWIGEMEKFCIIAADAVVSPSRYLLGEIAKDLSFNLEDCRVIPNPYQINSQGDTNVKTEISRNDVVFFGRLEHRKGIDNLIKYFRGLWDDGLNIPLTLIGNDTFFHPRQKMWSEYLKQKYKRYFDAGLLIYEGKLPPDKLYARIQKAHLVVIPSLLENFPYVVVEAMAQGKVVLVSESGGHKELVGLDEKYGFTFSHDDPNGFREKILKILDMSNDQLTQMGEKARLRVIDICSYEAVYPKKLEVIEKITASREKSRSFPYVNYREKDYEDKDVQSIPGLLSIVIPYYNMGPYLMDTLRSINESTYQAKEIIIVNDGSDDANSLAILYEVEKEYQVKIVHMHNSGLSTARNVGAHQAQGEFLAFLDPDDMVHSDYYQWAISLIQSYENVSFVGCWAEYFDGASGIWPSWNPEFPYLLVHNMINSGSVYKKKDFLNCGLNDPQMEYGMEDYESVIRMVKHGCMGVVIPKPYYLYRVRSDSMARNFNRDNLVYLYRLITEKHKDIYQEYATEVFNLLNNNGPGYLYDNPTWDFPVVGYNSNKETMVSGFDGSTVSIPIEVKEQLVKLWRNQYFKSILKLFFKLRLNKFFLK